MKTPQNLLHRNFTIDNRNESNPVIGENGKKRKQGDFLFAGGIERYLGERAGCDEGNRTFLRWLIANSRWQRRGWGENGSQIDFQRGFGQAHGADFGVYLHSGPLDFGAAGGYGGTRSKSSPAFMGSLTWRISRRSAGIVGVIFFRTRFFTQSGRLAQSSRRWLWLSTSVCHRSLQNQPLRGG